MTHLIFSLFLACSGAEIGAGSPAAMVAGPEEPVAAPPGCPYWYLAPCGEDHYRQFVCEPCRDQVYSCAERGDPRLKRWGESSWPCECIDPKTGELMDWKPECKGSTDW